MSLAYIPDPLFCCSDAGKLQIPSIQVRFHKPRYIPNGQVTFWSFSLCFYQSYDLMLILSPSRGILLDRACQPSVSRKIFYEARVISRKYAHSIDRSRYSIKFKLAFHHPRTPWFTIQARECWLYSGLIEMRHCSGGKLHPGRTLDAICHKFNAVTGRVQGSTFNVHPRQRRR